MLGADDDVDIAWSANKNALDSSLSRALNRMLALRLFNFITLDAADCYYSFVLLAYHPHFLS